MRAQPMLGPRVDVLLRSAHQHRVQLCAVRIRGRCRRSLLRLESAGVHFDLLLLHLLLTVSPRLRRRCQLEGLRPVFAYVYLLLLSEYLEKSLGHCTRKSQNWRCTAAVRLRSPKEDGEVLEQEERPAAKNLRGRGWRPGDSEAAWKAARKLHLPPSEVSGIANSPTSN